MVRDGFGDESGAKLIEQRGIDFAPSEDFCQTLKAAGASEAFLKALRAAVAPGLSPAQKRATGVPPVPEHGRDGHGTPMSADFKASATTAASEPASAKKPLNQVQVFALLVGQVPSHRVTMLVQERGIDFEPTDDYLQEVRLAGGEDELISALKSAKVTKPVTVDPVAQARQAEVRQHVARGAGFFQKRQYAQAEQEYRAALLLDSQDPDLYVSLGFILLQQGKWDDAASAAREALHLNPNNDMAHANLGVALESKGDWDGEITEEGEALRLNPNNDTARVALGAAFGNKGDRDREIAEYREAVRLNPNNDMAHVGLGLALGSKGDNDGMIAEEREALRLNPNNDMAHAALGAALEKKGDRRGALDEYRTAYTLDPKNATYKEEYESALRRQAATEAPAKSTVSTLLPRSTGEVLASAKTLCIVQENGSPVIKAEVEKKLLKWGHLTLVSSVNESDLLLVIAQTGQLNTVTGEGNQAAASLKDQQGGAVLWSTTKGGSWSYRGWSNAWVGRAIADELMKFIVSSTKGGR
jgi:tetratricopeptide (TPR) repeat protein